MQQQPPHARRSRFWLYAPFILLVLAAAGWSAAWVYIAGRADRAVDHWLAREAGAGRPWICNDRALGGYPFRLEFSCSSLTLRENARDVVLGPLRAVALAYQPSRAIVELDGPLKLTEPDGSLVATWKSFRASLRAGAGGLERGSLVAEDLDIDIIDFGPTDMRVTAASLEAHLRPHPTRWASDKAVEMVASAKRAAVPLLDDLVGGTDPADLEASITVDRVSNPSGRRLPAILEDWRLAGGRVEFGKVTLLKGARRAEARGELLLDDMRRPEGRIELAADGLEGWLGNLIGARGAGMVGALLGMLAGPQGGAATPEKAPTPGLKPLPTLRLEDGRVAFGPIPVPGVRLAPLY